MNFKTILLTLAAFLIAGVALAVIFVFSINPIIEKAVNTVGPEITKTPLTLGSANISFLSGEGELRDFILGNPEGFKSPVAISVQSVKVKLDPKSVASDTIHIYNIAVDAPVITYELLGGKNNITVIRNNIRKTADKFSAKSSPATKEKGSTQPAEESASKQIVIDHFLISGATVNLALPGMAEKPISLTLPNIELKDLGKKDPQGGIGAIAEEVFNTLTSKVVSTVTAGSVEDLKKQAEEGIKSVKGKLKSLFE